MIQTVELVELPGEDLILTESTLVHGKDLAMDSTLLPTLTLQSRTTTLVANRCGATVRDMNTRYNAVLVCDIAPGRKYGIRYRTQHLHLATTHFMGNVKVSWEREN